MVKGKKKVEKVEEIEEVKETKEKKKDYSIEKEDQRKLKGISKFLYVFSKVIRIFVIIAIVGIAIAMAAVPIITSNTETVKDGEQTILKVFDNEIYYNRTETTFEFYEKNDVENTTKITKKSDVDSLNKMFDYLEKNDMTKATIIAEVELGLFIVALVIETIILKKVYKFFKNIHDETTPFTLENISLLKVIGKLSIIDLIVSLVINMIISIVIESTYSVSFMNIIEILGIYFLLYVFKYGYKMQKETKGTIYSEE
jgi:hypothetical protein